MDGRERSLRELGEAMCVSVERVRQIEQAAVHSMRAASLGAPPRPPTTREWPRPGARQNGFRNAGVARATVRVRAT
jgi:hypothetical protein